MYLLFCTDFYIFRNFVFFVFLVVQYRRSVIYKIKRLDTNTRDFGYSPHDSGFIAYSKISTLEKRVQKGADSYVGFTGYVWTETESEKKKLRIHKNVA